MLAVVVITKKNYLRVFKANMRMTSAMTRNPPLSYCWATDHITCFFIYLFCGLDMLCLLDLARLLSWRYLKAIFSYLYACLDKICFPVVACVSMCLSNCRLSHFVSVLFKNGEGYNKQDKNHGWLLVHNITIFIFILVCNLLLKLFSSVTLVKFSGVFYDTVEGFLTGPL